MKPQNERKKSAKRRNPRSKNVKTRSTNNTRSKNLRKRRAQSPEEADSKTILKQRMSPKELRSRKKSIPEEQVASGNAQMGETKDHGLVSPPQVKSSSIDDGKVSSNSNLSESISGKGDGTSIPSELYRRFGVPRNQDLAQIAQNACEEQAVEKPASPNSCSKCSDKSSESLFISPSSVSILVVIFSLRNL